ncbi:MAG: hypothetical protein ACI9FR_001253 [Cryomorphaceae bacterium]|jgi:hypothetical protein
MKMTIANNNDQVESDLAESGQSLKMYEKPALVCYRGVRDITLGPSFGSEESDCAAAFKNSPGPC